MTGAQGMLGRHICSVLRDCGFKVLQVQRRQSKLRNTKCWDLRKWLSNHDLDKVFEKAQAVVHAGALVETKLTSETKTMYDINVRSCVNLAGWAFVRNIPIIFISTGAVYANTKKRKIVETDALGWNNSAKIYGFTKIMAEDALRRYQSRGLKLAVIRPSAVYGSGLSPRSIIAKFLNQASANNTLKIKEPVKDTLNFVHAYDVAMAIVKILKKKKWDTFNISGQKSISIYNLAKNCVSIGKKRTIFIIKKIKCRQAEHNFNLNSNKAHKILNWMPQLNFKESLKKLYLKNKDINNDSKDILRKY